MPPLHESMRQTIDWFRRQDDEARAEHEALARRNEADALAEKDQQWAVLDRARKGIEGMFGKGAD